MRAFKTELSLQHLRTPHLDTRRLLLSKVVNSLLCHCFHIFIEGQSRVQNFHHLQQLGKIPALRMPRRVSLYRWGCTSLTLCPSILEKCLFACMCVCMHTNERQGLQLEKSWRKLTPDLLETKVIRLSWHSCNFLLLSIVTSSGILSLAVEPGKLRANRPWQQQIDAAGLLVDFNVRPGDVIMAAVLLEYFHVSKTVSGFVFCQEKASLLVIQFAWKDVVGSDIRFLRRCGRAF